FGVAVWQNHALLDAANRPLERTTSAAAKRGSPGQLADTARAQVAVRRALAQGATAFERLARGGQLDPAQRRELLRAARSYDAAVAALPKEIPGRQPVTLGVGEPLGTTLTVSFYIAVLFALPLILYQLYAFVMPAFSPAEKRIVRPLMLLVPVLFAA